MISYQSFNIIFTNHHRTLIKILLGILIITIIYITFSWSSARAAVVNCQADRPGASNTVYLYYPTASDSDFPDDVGSVGATTSPLAAFDVDDLDSGIGTTAELRAAVTERVKVDYCEFDVRIVQTTSANGTTNPNPSDPRWQVVGIGSDPDGTLPTNELYGIAQNVDIGDSIATDFARVWAGEFDDQFGGAGGLLEGSNSTLARWANAIAGTASHEAGHNYGQKHSDALSQSTEDSFKNHLMASGTQPSGGIDGADRVKNRHFSDGAFEVLAANLGLIEQTVSNWDFINPNSSTADGFRIAVLVLPSDGTPSKISMYTGGLSPWGDVSISADGTETFKGTLYNRFDIDFTDAKSWDNGDDGEIPAGAEFHVGVGLSTNYIVRNTRLSSGGSALELRPRVVGYTTGGSFDPATGDFHVTFSNPDPEEGPLLLSNFVIRYIPRTVDIDQMVKGGALVGIDGLAIEPWDVRGTAEDTIEVSDTADVAVGNLAEGRAVDFVFEPDPTCERAVVGPPPVEDAVRPAEIEYCPEGHVLGLFPSTRVYFEMTVTDPNARFFDPDLGTFVQGPLKSRIFVQIPGEKPDLNENGVDDAIDIADGTCTDEDDNGVCDHVEPGAFKYSAKLICGVQDNPHDTKLVQGLYATAINILNPNEERARFTKKLSLTYPPEEQRPGRVLLIGEDELGPDEALEVDCTDIRRELFPDGYPTSYIKGFVVITSNMSLDVTAVYTSRALDTGKRCRKAKHGDDYCRKPPRHCKTRDGQDCRKPAASGDISIDVEQIRERKPEPKEPPARPRPDLVVRDIGQPSVRCYGGKGTCRTRVDVIVANVGSGNAGPFKVRVAFDPAQSVVVDVPVAAGLVAGGEQTLTVTTPPGGNCFNPDCTITATADSETAVEESDEGNNQRSETTPG